MTRDQELNTVKGLDMRAPDDDIKPVWDKMTEEEKLWYTKFHRATRRHDWKALRELCDMAPGANYERLYKEISYELSIGSRLSMPPRNQRKARFSEFDYGWEQPSSSTPSPGYVVAAANGVDRDFLYKHTPVKFGADND
jgi:hypothetical protein